MKRRALALLALGAAVPACAGYNIWTGEYTVPRADLEAALAKRFPASVRYAEAFAVTVSNQQLALDPAANRLRLVCALRIAQPALLPQPLTGTLALSSGLVFDAPSRSVQLHDPAADRLDLPGLAREGAALLQAVGTTVARELLRGWPLHSFTEDELRFGGRALQVGAIRVADEGLVVEVR
jgi:hypothetical protein